jgi:hypothetical protein
MELMLMLRAYKEGLVLVGGWAPYFILKQFQEPGANFEHIGSIDIDIAVNPAVISENEYATLEQLLLDRGYQQRPEALFSYKKTIQTGATEQQIVVDFLGPEDGGTSASHRHQRVQDDFMLRKARGANLAFEHKFEHTLIGKLPNGADGEVSFYVADIVAMLAMKSYVLGQRYKDKDAYDFYNLLAYYKGGVQDVANEIKPYIGVVPYPEGIENIREWFGAQNAPGPNAVADFDHLQGEARDLMTRQVFEQVQRLLDLLNSGETSD